MWNPVVILVLCLCSLSNAVPLGLKKNMDIVMGEDEPMLMLATDEEPRPEAMISRLNLPSNATSIRADITDGFSCDNKTYGYYADVENECQIFHVCLPVTYADGKENTFRWSFICPEETVFSQDSFTCMRPEDMSIDCEESFKYYELNRNFGVVETEDAMPSEEDELNMEEMSRKPPNSDVEENSQQPAYSIPVKKQTIKVQNSNRRKTQANRINDAAQRRKVSPVRKTSAVPTITVKPVEEEQVPIIEPEVERTTVKYQRFTKRPSNLVKEPSKLEFNPPVTKVETPKPEQPIIRQDLYTQKRKRPQVFSTTRLDAAVQTDDEPEPQDSLKSEIIPEPQSETVASPDQVEAQASEIAEVSMKPHVEKIAEPIPIEPEVVESLAVTKNEPEPKPEVEPLPQNTASRAEVVEIPIQKVDQPLVIQAPVVVAPVPEEPKLSSDLEQAVKVEEDKVENEKVQAEQAMQAELTKVLEKEKEQEAEKSVPEMPNMPEESAQSEKVLLEPKPEADKIPEAEEPEKVMESVKSAIIPVVQEPAAVADPALEPETPIAEANKAVAPVVEPEAPLIIESKPEDTVALRSEIAIPSEEKTSEESLEVEIPAPEPGMGQHKAKEPVVIEDKLEEIPAPVPEMPLKSETPAAEAPLVIDLPVSIPEESLKIASEPQSEPEKPLESEGLAAPDSEMTKGVEVPPVPEEIPLEKPAEVVVEPLMALSPEPQTPADSEAKPQPQQPVEDIKAQAPSEQLPVSESVEHMEAQPSAEDSVPAASNNVDTQSLILDFIANLVNSENSNLKDQMGIPNDVQAVPEPAATEEHKVEEKYPVPQYIPMMQNNEAMYQIPVQVIESPEPAPEATRSEVPISAEAAPESMPQIPVEAVAEPESALPAASEAKLPLNVEDVVELLKESLDTPVQKENLIQEPSVDQSEPQSEPQPDSTEVKPIYHRYVEFGSNLLKPEPLSANDEEEPTVISATNDDSAAQEVEQKSQPANTLDAPVEPELPKAADLPSEPEQLASEQKPALNILATPDAAPADELPSEPASVLSEAERLAMSRSLNRFHMDPRKRRFLFRSDAS